MYSYTISWSSFDRPQKKYNSFCSLWMVMNLFSIYRYTNNIIYIILEHIHQKNNPGLDRIGFYPVSWGYTQSGQYGI